MGSYYIEKADSVAPRSDCADVQSDLELHCRLRGSYYKEKPDSVAPSSDCADVQSDLELHCPHMS